MSTLPSEHKGRTNWWPINDILQWGREWISRGSTSELRCCAEEEVERIAKDAGVSVSELRRIVRLGPGSADLLQHRMEALDLDPNEVARIEPQTLHDLQRVCTMCKSHRRCARDLAEHANDPAWKDYCPNAETLMALNAQPWASRRQW